MENAKEEHVGWGKSSVGWLRAVDNKEDREVTMKNIGAIKSVGGEKEENHKRTERIEFCLHSGALKTILRPKDVDRKKIKVTKDTGSNFVRQVENLFVTWEQWSWESVNKSDMKVVAQVAEVTKPLASAVEMVQADSIVVPSRREELLSTWVTSRWRSCKTPCGR